ncbi:hypothetical protein ISG29_13800 [Nocardioides sp. CBS4Y-1]|uniref:Uncharacterized protein n=1 Tax=Nocardioides acrostichi TaxID=2784339 RepID=A0A930V2N1_9ACTN|nr:hypothetical protein [Nocardioides acrostichi]
MTLAGQEGAGGHLAHLVRVTPTGETPCRLPRSPDAVTVTTTAGGDVRAEAGSSFPMVRLDTLAPGGAPATLVVETDTSCRHPRRPIRSIEISLADGDVALHLRRGQRFDLGCGVRSSDFGVWQ